MTDVLIAKQQSLERCLARVRHAWEQPSKLPFEQDYDRQDIIVLNLQRACEQAFDMANHVVAAKKLGWPRFLLGFTRMGSTPDRVGQAPMLLSSHPPAATIVLCASPPGRSSAAGSSSMESCLRAHQ